jgi:hypothetical protein
MSSFHLRNAVFVFRGLFGVSSGSYLCTRMNFSTAAGARVLAM